MTDQTERMWKARQRTNGPECIHRDPKFYRAIPVVRTDAAPFYRGMAVAFTITALALALFAWAMGWI